MTARFRSLALALALAATLAATWYVSGLEDADDDLVAAPRRSGSVVPARAVADTSRAVHAEISPRPSVPALAAPAVRMDPQAAGDPFAARSWQPVPPPPPPTPAVTLRAPALPYRYLGRMEEAGGIVVFLAEGNDRRPRIVRQGDLLPDYRVDEITPQGMRLTYLPLNETQRLLFGSTP